MRRCIIWGTILLLITTLSACQPTPETSAVTSKNDGAFEAAVQATPAAVAEPDSSIEEAEAEYAEAEAEAGRYTASFNNASDNLYFTIDLDAAESNEAMPVIQITPHTITSEEAEQIARAIFGDAAIYEYSTELSRSAIEEEILTLKQYISDWDTLVAYYDGDEATARGVKEDFEARIAAYEAMYATASDTVEASLCDWTFHSASYYLESGGGITADESYDDTESIKASVLFDGMPYVLNIRNRESSDYRLHYVSAYINDTQVSQSEKYSAQEPTEDEIADAVERAAVILEQMGMGQWDIVSSEVQSWEDYNTGKTLYSIYIQATPVYRGIQVTHHEQLANLKSEDAYAADYYYEEAEFYFSGGLLVSFWYYSPADIVAIANEDVEIKSFDEIVEYLKNYLYLMDGSDFISNQKLQIDISQVVLGLSRVRIKNNESDFYLTPTYTFYGSVTLADKEADAASLYELAVINAVDGSIIDTTLGY